MDLHHAAVFIAIGTALFASLTGAAIALGVALWSTKVAKARQRV